MSAVVESRSSAKGRALWVWSVPFLATLAVILYARVLRLLAAQWWDQPDYSHGFLVPIFVGYLVWRSRHQWRAAVLRPNNYGLLVMVVALFLLLAGTLGAELFTCRFSLVLLLVGMVLFLAGRRVLRILAFPLGFLLLMIPLPGLIYNQITFPLQLMASRFAAASLSLLQVPVLREGNLLVLPNYTLEVVDACSGIRSLMSLAALAIGYGYVAERRMGIRVALAALMLPIAVISNGLRIVGTGVLTYVSGRPVAEGFFHFFSGWLIFLTATAMMLLSHWSLRGFSWEEEVVE